MIPSRTLTDTGSMVTDEGLKPHFARLHLLSGSRILMTAAPKQEDHCACLDSALDCGLPPRAPVLYLGQFLPALSLPSPGLIPLITYAAEVSACLVAEAMLAQMQTRTSLFVSYMRQSGPAPNW